EQAVAVLVERRGVEHALVDGKPNEPAKQKVELDSLDQLALRADRIEKLQKRRPQQTLRRKATAVRFDRKAPKTLRRVRPGPRSSVAASPAADASPVSAPPCQRTRTTPRSSDPRPASTPRDSPTHRPRESRDNNKHQKTRASLLQQPARCGRRTS